MGAKIIAMTDGAGVCCAAAARISTTAGGALEIFERSRKSEKNAALIEKVTASGHTSLLEHACFTIAFDGVSACAEQFVIGFRLGSYTVQSRRYVDFSDAGFYVPNGLGALETRWRAHMKSLMADYAALLEMGVPKEDARFVLPYCFRSNFYVTMNARELLKMTARMRKSEPYEELRDLGDSLAEQIEPVLPNLLARAEQNITPKAPPRMEEPADPESREAKVILRAATVNAWEVLREAAAFEGGDEPDMAALVRGGSARALEFIGARFEMQNLSLAAVTHLTRHRMQSFILPPVCQAAVQNSFVRPETIEKNARARAIYEGAFERNTRTLRAFLREGMAAAHAQYFALAGNQLSALCGMNGRELLHFLKLRTCERAQWEIRGAARQLLLKLREVSGEVYDFYGPACVCEGRCPEGRLSCGKAAQMREMFGTEKTFNDSP